MLNAAILVTSLLVGQIEYNVDSKWSEPIPPLPFFAHRIIYGGDTWYGVNLKNPTSKSWAYLDKKFWNELSVGDSIILDKKKRLIYKN